MSELEKLRHENVHLGAEVERMRKRDAVQQGRLQEVCQQVETLTAKLKQTEALVEDVRRTLFLFREFVSNNAKVWALGSSHHHPIWQQVAETLGPINSDRPTEQEYPLVRDASLSDTSTVGAPK